MNLKRLFSLSILMLTAALIINACATATPQVIEKEKVITQIVTQEVEKFVTQEVEKIVTQEVIITKEVEKQVLVTPVPVARKGAWVDTIIFTSINEASNAVAQLQADAIDLYAYAVEDPDVFETVKADPNLKYSMSYGYWDSLLFNPSGPTFQDGRLNPFSNPKIREAINWLIDREYLVQELLGGLGFPKWLPLNTAFPDYALYADLIRPLETKYAYNFEKAKEIISAEMQAMGASLNADGKWSFNGEVVVIIGLIRSEDEREEIGNYFSNQLEALGFTVDRQIRTRNELAPIWQQSDPTLGEWHWYTGGNYYPLFVRNDSQAFAGYYTSLVASTTTEEAFNPSPELLDIATRVFNNEYENMQERRDLFAQGFPLALENSQYVQVFATNSFYPRKAELVVGTDLSSGVGGSQIWPYTIRWEGREGGVVRSANSGILTGPWNPSAGMNWLQELMLVRASIDDAVMADPYTGLYWPQRLERAEVQAVNGVPIQSSLDWVTLEFVDQIPVPEDAWADWDAVNQKFISVGEKYPEGTNSRSKVTVYYPSDIWNIKWHDGSTLSIGDFVNFMIYQFDNCKLESAIYDEAVVSTCDAFMSHFKGVRIISQDPLVIETYEDLVDVDAEVQVGGYFTNRWWPITNTGQMAWHSYTLGMLAEAARELAFSADKSTALGVDWTNYIDGPSLAILKKYLDQAQAENYIPYAPTLSQFITAEEAKTRYENLRNWYILKGHFWVGTGLFYLDQVNSVEGSVVMQRFPDFPDPANKWDRFGEPKLAVLDISGPVKVTAGEEATFDAFVTYNSTPYPQNEIQYVSYLVYDAAGNLVTNGMAELVTDGQYQVRLSGEVTKLLPGGAGKIEFVVAPIVVAMPTFSSFEFVVTNP